MDVVVAAALQAASFGKVWNPQDLQRAGPSECEGYLRAPPVSELC